MLYNLLVTVISDEVKRLWPRRDATQAMLIDFNAKVDYDKEEGYRHVQLLVYAPCNYVQVWMRKTWDITTGDNPNYIKGASTWRLLCDHDSCWRDDGLMRFFRENGKDITNFFGIGHWYELIDIPDNLADLKRQQRP